MIADYLCSTVEPGVIWQVQDPHNCSTFYECFDGKVIGYGSCPSNYWFNINAQTCVPQSETTCAGILHKNV